MKHKTTVLYFRDYVLPIFCLKISFLFHEVLVPVYRTHQLGFNCRQVPLVILSRKEFNIGI